MHLRYLGVLSAVKTAPLPLTATHPLNPSLAPTLSPVLVSLQRDRHIAILLRDLSNAKTKCLHLCLHEIV